MRRTHGPGGPAGSGPNVDEHGVAGDATALAGNENHPNGDERVPAAGIPVQPDPVPSPASLFWPNRPGTVYNKIDAEFLASLDATKAASLALRRLKDERGLPYAAGEGAVRGVSIRISVSVSMSLKGGSGWAVDVAIDRSNGAAAAEMEAERDIGGRDEVVVKGHVDDLRVSVSRSGSG
ncbi:hypothetical protein LY76DRAFT_651485 [Colletotrichum caudatum]|nr:hypothetical protein LY76DRAFT_651485 [Colletotrichum caudatum]